MKQVKFGVTKNLSRNAWREWPFWLCSHMDFPPCGAPLKDTGHIWGLLALSRECVGVNVEGGTEAYFRRLASSSV